jgi:hypothetical protein
MADSLGLKEKFGGSEIQTRRDCHTDKELFIIRNHTVFSKK